MTRNLFSWNQYLKELGKRLLGARLFLRGLHGDREVVDVGAVRLEHHRLRELQSENWSTNFCGANVSL